MDQQAEGMPEHLNRLGIAQGLAMQPCQIMSQTSVFAFDSNDIGLADNLVTIRNEAWIDWVPLAHPEVTLPNRD